jgi:hypothetical protein
MMLPLWTCGDAVVSTETYIHQKNIERYRQMLESDRLTADERQTILKLLAEEEDRDRKVSSALAGPVLKGSIP